MSGFRPIELVRALTPALLGVLAHISFFRLNEHHMNGVSYLQTGLVLTTLFTAYLFFVQGTNIWTIAALISSTLGPFLAGLYSSLLLYRLVWHPLRRFPGPLWARITSLWFSAHVAAGDAHIKLLQLHERYGQFVRIGSSDLSIAHPQAVDAIYGPRSACRKGSWYDEDWPRSSIHTSRSHEFHAKRRRVWSGAFSDKNLRDYEQRIKKFNGMLTDRIRETQGEPVNVTDWFNMWAFDIMGDLAFGQDFSMLETGSQHWAIKLLKAAMELQALHLPTWIFRMIVAIPGLTKDYWKFIGYCDNELYKRLKREPEVADLMSTLIPTVGKGPESQQNMLTLLSDSRTIIVAGSDTTSATLTNTFVMLSKHPEHVDIIRREIEAVKDEGEPKANNVALQKAEHLNAVINETLRLYPVVPSIVQRKTPPEGIMVGETHIPGGTNVTCPQYVLGRDERCYEKAGEFVPERWYSKPEMLKEKGAYAPFSVGTYGCIGKPLALLELRSAIARLIENFDPSFASDQDEKRFVQMSKDKFILTPPDLMLCFKPRKVDAA